jgi:hypothetical protein
MAVFVVTFVMSDAEKVIRVIGFGGEVIEWPVWEEKFVARS